MRKLVSIYNLILWDVENSIMAVDVCGAEPFVSIPCVFRNIASPYEVTVCGSNPHYERGGLAFGSGRGW